VDREGRRLEWRMLPHDFPPWEAVYQQTQRWLAAGVFEAMAHDLRGLLRLASGREPEPTAAILEHTHAALHPRERCARGLRRGQTQEGLQGPRGGGLPGPPAGAAFCRKPVCLPCAGMPARSQ
jgi:hypothetical protein